ncbi:CRISPR-associated protein Cas2 [Pilibacter termitis]|uniref:CRISPR-associated endoribonuclease Cas2 n=1 Tax=Pilibacter termitis TaxID=263852 RepID=A0A1T4NCE1_9ENTE|nr:CRISPR-associated endonuclease Cas2 [Pilibacter termitis]SJZ76919.1 CRISPR-associated protein Cas2 [Pilibacter termitis]
MRLFNLDENEIFLANKKPTHWLLIYDIVSNKRRVKLSKILEGYGVRVQKSCFEGRSDEQTFQRLKREMQEFYMKHEGDNIVLFRLTTKSIVRFGETQNPEVNDGVMIF